MKTKTTLRLFSVKIALIAFLAVTFISSCKKDNVRSQEETTNIKDEQLYAQLLRSGVKPADIKDEGKYYVVEGDMEFEKNNTDIAKVAQYFNGGNLALTLLEDKNISSRTKGTVASARNSGEIAQWRTNSLISTANVENIKVSTNNSPWPAASANAVRNWQDIPNCKIHFNDNWTSLYYGTANTIVFLSVPQSEIPGDIARAQFPTNDFPGYRIRISSSITNLSVSQQTLVLTHEIGHCMGLRHTNWQAYQSEQGSPYGAIQIPGTPATDPGSIMNIPTSAVVPNWTAFSFYDTIAAQALYPYGTYGQWLTDINYFSGYNEDPMPAITWNAGLVSTSTVSLEIFQHGVSKGIIASHIPNNGSYVIDLRLPILQPEGHTWPDLQIRLIADDNPSISDMSPGFAFFWD